MANKRDLKKAINYICRDLFSECIATSLYCNKKDSDEVNSILTSIIIMRNNFVRRISHPEPGMKPKVYYKDLKEKFNIESGEIADTIVNM